MTLATKTCLIETGVLQRHDRSLTVYNPPANLFMADFVSNPAVNSVHVRGMQQANGMLALAMQDGTKAVFNPLRPCGNRHLVWPGRRDIQATELVFSQVHGKQEKQLKQGGQAADCQGTRG